MYVCLTKHKICVNRLNDFYNSNVIRTKKTKFILYVREFPNKNFKNDEQILCCQSYEKSVSTNHKESSFLIKVFDFHMIKTTAISNKKKNDDQIFINYQVEYMSVLNKYKIDMYMY